MIDPPEKITPSYLAAWAEHLSEQTGLEVMPLHPALPPFAYAPLIGITRKRVWIPDVRGGRGPWRTFAFQKVKGPTEVL